MNDDHIELLNTFDKMNPENRACLLALFRLVYAAQENGKQVLRKQLRTRGITKKLIGLSLYDRSIGLCCKRTLEKGQLWGQ
jgi:hypothetical protein